MPHVSSSGGDDLGSTDEVKVFKDEGDGEDEKRSSENLTEEKSSLIDLTESEEKSGGSYSSSKNATRTDHSPVFAGKLDGPPHTSSFNMGYLVSPYSYANGAAGPIPVSMNNEESSDEEDCILAIGFPSRKKKVRMEFYIEKVVTNYSLQQFKEHFRMPKPAFEQLLRLLAPSLNNSVGRPTTDIEKQLLAVIWLLATPDSFRSVGDRFDLSKSSLFRCFLRVISGLNKIAPLIIKWPFIPEERERTKIGFAKYGLNDVIGAIDGTYIQIKAPKYHPEAYICRKKFHAITLQAICNDKLKFTDCFVGYPGSVHDLRIFKNSDIYRSIMNNPDDYFPNEEYIIGDKAYCIRNWCISPYINRGGLNHRQIKFNKVLSSTRQAIERAFALLKGRFRRLKYLEMSRIDLIPATILSCCVLHNICLENNDLDENYIEEGQQNDVVFIDENIDDVREDEAGMMKRDRIARRL